MMKLMRIALSLIGVVACSRVAAPNVVPGPNSALPSKQVSSGGYHTIFSFNGTDGSNPVADLIALKGVLYGTTMKGGKYNRGTVFSLSASGNERVLHDFQGAPNDGGWPEAGLIAVNGKLYGTTWAGGNGTCGYSEEFGCGTIFEITTSGKERVLHNCKAGLDIALPNSDLILVKGTLYGTSLAGRYGYGFGAVYSTTTAGDVDQLYEFKGYPNDGMYIHARLLALSGVMYGTNIYGGANKLGAIFSLTTAGKEQMLYSFRDLPDGHRPQAGLIDVNGTLYGTTQYGGVNKCTPRNQKKTYGCGSVFAVTPSGTENVLYRFQGDSDGAYPVAPVTALNGTLYGTTSTDGAYGSGGTLFAISASGSESVLHSFGQGTDGSGPQAALLSVGGTLYGTTASGGTYGNGTVFALTP